MTWEVKNILGFQYICNLYNVQYIEIAELLQISKQTINSWTSGRRNIPRKYLPKLSEKFQVPEEYFQKELTKEDELKIQRIKIDNGFKELIKENGKSFKLNEEGEKLFDLNMKLTKEETEQRFKRLLEIKEDDDDTLLNTEKHRFLDLVGDIIESRNFDEQFMAIKLLEMILHYFNPTEEKYNMFIDDESSDDICENKYLDEHHKALSKNESEMFENIKQYFEIQDKYSKIIEEQNILPLPWETNNNNDNN